MSREWITMADYLGRYDADSSAAVRVAAGDLLVAVNELLDAADADGVQFHSNPGTGNLVSGQGNGGYRPPYVRVGAKHSKHRTGHAVDIYDPRRELAAWCIAHTEPACSKLGNPDRLAEFGFAMEDPRWAPTWTHLQDLLPASGKRVFIPSSEPPLAKALPGQEALA